MDVLGNREILKTIDAGLGEWRKLAQPLMARYRVADGVRGAEFAAAVAREAVACGYEVPEIRLGPGFVDVTLYTVDAHSGRRRVTDSDIDRARCVSRLAAEHGLSAHPGEVTQIELVLDTPSAVEMGPFWSALLTGDRDRALVRDTVFDSTNRVPSTWFQATGQHPTPRQRWHIDLWLAPETADERIARALAAGGTVVDDTHAPSFTVLADPDGNRVCVCTALDRV
ncbi:VOC family protein [Streptomyces sp. NPDC006879]|uniref:VOC family protein n=1 Tax=Streptomyces sp. NPDC006879 TaxID=3364767 RepID=UPI003685FEA7